MKMIEPTIEDIGTKKVYYKQNWMKPENYEYGFITGFNEKWVFVRYGTNTQSQATNRTDLYWANIQTYETLDKLYRIDKIVHECIESNPKFGMPATKGKLVSQEIADLLDKNTTYNKELKHNEN